MPPAQVPTSLSYARADHTAVWTASEMIFWGGSDGSWLDTGLRYNPLTDTWTAVSTLDEPDGRSKAAFVWTGTELIIWGGQALSCPFYPYCC